MRSSAAAGILNAIVRDRIPWRSSCVVPPEPAAGCPQVHRRGPSLTHSLWTLWATRRHRLCFDKQHSHSPVGRGEERCAELCKGFRYKGWSGTRLDQHRLTEYLKRQMPHAREHRVVGLKRISGGSSRETYAFDLEWSEAGETRTRPMIGRRDPTGGLLKSDREREFKVIDAMHRAGLKVPEPLFLELDASVMDRPFFIMHRAAGQTGMGAFPAAEAESTRAKVADDFLERARAIAIDRLSRVRARDSWRSEKSGGSGTHPGRALERNLRTRSDGRALSDPRRSVRVAQSQSGR